jgi:RNA polymerase sigma-70 factor, ECF subfamily
MDDVTRLARAAGTGDRVAQAAFVRATQSEVWRLCAHLVDGASADDLTQEAYLRALPALASFRGDSSARTWLLSIARRTCADAVRSRVRRRRLHGRLAARSAVSAPPVEPDSAGRIALDDLLNRLSEERRTAFVLTQVLGLGYAEAAEVCGCPLGTIRSRVARAREDLVAAIAPSSLEAGSG